MDAKGAKDAKARPQDAAHTSQAATPQADKALTSRYVREKLLGSGTYSRVYLARDTAKPGPNNWVAVKSVDISLGDGIPYTSIREIALLQDLSHPNIVRLEDVCQNGTKRLYLVFEYLEGDLKALLKSDKPPLSIMKVKAFLFQILKGVSVCHRHGVVHRDLKPENILVGHSSGQTVLKIADFGLARGSFVLPARRLTREVVTIWYRPPELLLGGSASMDMRCTYDKSVDMWSIGCIFFELLARRPLFNSITEIGMLFDIFQLLGTPSEATWPSFFDQRDFKHAMFPRFPVDPDALQKLLAGLGCALDAVGMDLLKRMLACSRDVRISMQDALEHPWFDDLLSGHRHLLPYGAAEPRSFAASNSYRSSPNAGPIGRFSSSAPKGMWAGKGKENESLPVLDASSVDNSSASSSAHRSQPTEPARLDVECKELRSSRLDARHKRKAAAPRAAGEYVDDSADLVCSESPAARGQENTAQRQLLQTVTTFPPQHSSPSPLKKLRR